MKDLIKLPSGKEMKIQIAPWETGRDLYQTVLSEAKSLEFKSVTELDESFILRIGMLALSSKPIEKAIWTCMDKVLIDNERVTKDYFEPEENRDDYFTVLMEVGKANIKPFMKSLYAQYAPLLEMLKKSSQA